MGGVGGDKPVAPGGFLSVSGRSYLLVLLPHFFSGGNLFFGGIFFPLPSTLLVTVTELREQGSTVATGPKSERASNRS